MAAVWCDIQRGAGKRRPAKTTLADQHRRAATKRAILASAEIGRAGLIFPMDPICVCRYKRRTKRHYPGIIQTISALGALGRDECTTNRMKNRRCSDVEGRRSGGTVVARLVSCCCHLRENMRPFLRATVETIEAACWAVDGRRLGAHVWRTPLKRPTAKTVT